eukprot:7602200-Pyramimonas_sp.AAC.1
MCTVQNLSAGRAPWLIDSRAPRSNRNAVVDTAHAHSRPCPSRPRKFHSASGKILMKFHGCI